MTFFRSAVLVPLMVLFLACLLLPLIETDVWWVRFQDFPRVQILGGLILVLIAFLFTGGWKTLFGKSLIVLSLAALIYQGASVLLYLTASGPDGDTRCVEGEAFDVLVANVQKNNRLEDGFFQLVEANAPDVLLVLETDEWWDKQLSRLHDEFPAYDQHIPEDAEFYGMHLLTKFEMRDSEIKTYVSMDTPTITTEIALPSGEAIRFIGIHPRPPNTDRQPSTKRDANMIAAALEAREASLPVILAGDFNATNWERIFRRTMEIGGFVDPRRDFGLMPSFSAKDWAMAWPLDHVVHQPGLYTPVVERLPPFGSDHYAILATLCLTSSASGELLPDVSEKAVEEGRQTLVKARQMEETNRD